MNYHIEKETEAPAYLQLYWQLRDDIINGIYPNGSKIPSKRLIAVESGVSVITVKHALELLCEEGYLEAKERSGYFVLFAQEDFLGNPNVVQSNVIEGEQEVLSVGEFPYTVLAKTMRKVILDYEDRMLVKSPNYGCMFLREEICSYLARSRSIVAEPKQVIIGSGAEYLYGLIAQLFAGEARFAIENPSYSKIGMVYDAFKVPYDRLTLLPDGISTEELMQTKATVLHTTPFHSFPSGVTIDSSKKHEYLNWAKKNNGYIVEDNYDSELTVLSKPEDSLFSLSENQNVIYINTFSKTISPSMRIGYMILPKKLLNVYQERLGFYSCTVPVFDQYVLAELLHSGDFERHVNRERRKRRKQRAND